MNDIDIEEGRRLAEAARARPYYIDTHRYSEWLRNNAAAMFDAIETGRREMARIDHYLGYVPQITGDSTYERVAALVATFRDLADRTPTPTDGA